MQVITRKTTMIASLAVLTLSVSGGLMAQEQGATPPSDITVTGQPVAPDPSQMTEGPELKGFITARRGDMMQVTGDDGSNSVVTITDATKVKAKRGLIGSKKLASDSLLNGLPVTVKTLQWSGGLVASQIIFRNGDYKTASMIRTGTAQGFSDQTAATQALRGRMADIDKYDIKGTTNINFDTGKAALSAQARTDLCATASAAEGMDNALMLVVGYTDARGSEEYNQVLSEKRASSVINYLQQTCRWKPYRMLTPTGMAEADPLAPNDTQEGMAQNRRVSVNILVSKALDGL